jgi:hypothetical protein
MLITKEWENVKVDELGWYRDLCKEGSQDTNGR